MSTALSLNLLVRSSDPSLVLQPPQGTGRHIRRRPPRCAVRTTLLTAKNMNTSPTSRQTSHMAAAGRDRTSADRALQFSRRRLLKRGVCGVHGFLAGTDTRRCRRKHCRFWAAWLICCVAEACAMLFTDSRASACAVFKFALAE